MKPRRSPRARRPGRGTTQAQSTRIGLHIRAARRHRGYTQEELAGRLGLSTNFIAHLERGSRNPSLGTLTAVAGILDIGLADLFKAEAPGPRARAERPLVRRLVRLLQDAPDPVLRTLLLIFEDDRPRD